MNALKKAATITGKILNSIATKDTVINSINATTL